jgi:hypothetical protein
MQRSDTLIPSCAHARRFMRTSGNPRSQQQKHSRIM